MKIKNFWARPLLLAFLAGGLSACSAAATAPTTFPQFLGLEGATVVGTGKTVADHIVSFTTGKNCSTVRKNTGRHYCEEDEVAPPENVFCYSTLGDVTCYDRPAPHGETKRHVGKVVPGSGPAR